MKLILLIVFLTTSLFAMYPQSKDDCFLAYTKFNALRETCKHQYGSKQTNVEARQLCVIQFYGDFLEECFKEASDKKSTSNN